MHSNSVMVVIKLLDSCANLTMQESSFGPTWLSLIDHECPEAATCWKVGPPEDQDVR